MKAPQKYADFLREVSNRQARLIAQWQLVGFIHGVMNTDNMAISGETIDFGPCAFMNAYDPATVFSSIDRGGRYAYGNQPNIAQWNLARFAETLLPLLDADEEKAVAIAMELLNEFPARFERYWLDGMRQKLGLLADEPGDLELVQSLLDWMQKSRADFTNTFLDLSSVEPPPDELHQDSVFRDWHSRWQQRLGLDDRAASIALMRNSNPVVIPRNHRVEEALAAAEERDDLSFLHRLLAVLESPFEAKGDIAPYQVPSPNDDSYRTYCGT